MTALKDDRLDEGAARLRRDFDAAFAAAPPSAATDTEDLLAIRVAGAPYALKLRELSGLVVAQTIVKLPTRAADLLGVAGIRGSVIAVFNLETLLGYVGTRAPSYWLALSGGSDPMAMAFPTLDGFLRVSKDEVHESEKRGALATSALRAKEYVQVGSVTRPIVDVMGIREILRVRAGLAGSEMDR